MFLDVLSSCISTYKHKLEKHEIYFRIKENLKVNKTNHFLEYIRSG
ncbi:protein of unknown function [Candidatus Nitrosocosmicus franklandus]|uniref:Uncharacterized protein n=1 Tax=Candidatus Nitrosocosmicus franklandianus TaxID=1798806 RepID=A0A484I4M2_9ARCH|nr:protein of unknown function [Candidatus Nitrosocosmicus franklandus]